jgi:hypothetical protein
MPNPCATGEGETRLYAVALRNGTPALPWPGEIELSEDDEPLERVAERSFVLGPGLPGDVVPHNDGVLIPGGALGGLSLVPVPGSSQWRTYWREEQVDTF